MPIAVLRVHFGERVALRRRLAPVTFLTVAKITPFHPVFSGFFGKRTRFLDFKHRETDKELLRLQITSSCERRNFFPTYLLVSSEMIQCFPKTFAPVAVVFGRFARVDGGFAAGRTCSVSSASGLSNLFVSPCQTEGKGPSLLCRSGNRPAVWCAGAVFALPPECLTDLSTQNLVLALVSFVAFVSLSPP